MIALNVGRVVGDWVHVGGGSLGRPLAANASHNPGFTFASQSRHVACDPQRLAPSCFPQIGSGPSTNSVTMQILLVSFFALAAARVAPVQERVTWLRLRAAD